MAIAFGCSKISFCMKCWYGPSAASPSRAFMAQRALGLVPARVDHGDPVRRDQRDVAVFQVDEAVGQVAECRAVRREVVLFGADADHERRAGRAATRRCGSFALSTAIRACSRLTARTTASNRSSR